MFEKEAEEYQTEKRKKFNEHEQLCWGDVYKDWKKGAEYGYEQGIARLRYCCTCKHYIGRCFDGTEPYGICAD